jgi:hypothetical protein
LLSPILVRPVREQLEHDRVIRLLQAKYKRKFEVAINPGHEQTMPVGTGTDAWYPDLVLQSPDKSRKLLGVVEVETAESVNHLEAMSQWAALSRLRAPFHLYVPVAYVDSSRRLAADLGIAVAELWAYQAIGDQMRFTVVQKAPGAAEPKGNRPAVTEAAEPSHAQPAAAHARPAAQPKDAHAAAARKDAKKVIARKEVPKKRVPARPAVKGKAAAASTGKTKAAPKAKAAAPRRAATKTPARKAPAARAQKRK